MKTQRIRLGILLLAICLVLSGCRTRITGSEPAERNGENETAEVSRSSEVGSLPVDGGDEKAEQEKDGEPGPQTRENPEASRKEYDENASAELVPGTDRRVYGEGEGAGAFTAGEETDPIAAKLNDAAEETAKQTVAARQAEKKGVSEDAEEADSAMTYYTVLLQDRMGSLFECQRLEVYWETTEDHVTVYKTSPEHELILQAGAYDVSGRLLVENLRVDDGWISRKNPGMIVKAVDRSVLGTGVVSTGAAQAVYAGLKARDGWQAMDAVRNGRVLLLSEELLEAPYLQVAAMLIIAQCAQPELLADVNVETALEMLAEEATGIIPSGIYYYRGN